MKQLLYATIMCLFVVTTTFAQTANTAQNQNREAAQDYLQRMKANPETGMINPADVLKARQEADKVAENHSKKSSSIDWEFMGPDNIGGDTRAILTDKDNPQKLIAGGMTGGIFTSNDGGLSWTDHPQNIELAGLFISSITQGLDGAIYIGTGVDRDAYPGNGVYKSTDGGMSFQILEETIPSYQGEFISLIDWAYIQSIAASPVHSNWVYAATNQGLQISQDGGITWSKANGIPSNSKVYSMAIASDGKTHILAGRYYYRAEDGLNFTNELEVGSDIDKVMAMAPSNNDYLYIVTIDFIFQCLEKVWESKNGGTTWTSTSYEEDDSFRPLECTGATALSLAVNPVNPSQLFLGGIALWSWEEEVGWNKLEGIPSNTATSYINNFVFDSSDANTLYLASIRGILKSTNAQSSSPTFAFMNKNYRTAQFYDMAANLDGYVIGGAQSNGTILMNPDRTIDETLEGEFILNGTGGVCAVSKLKPEAMFASIQRGAIRRTPNNNVPFSSFFDENTDCCSSDGRLDGGALFITPFVLWEDVLGNILNGEINSKFVTGNCTGEVWMTEGALDFSTTPTWRKIGQFSNDFTCISAIAVSSSGTSIYVGGDDGKILHITDLDSDTPSVVEVDLAESFQYITSINVLHNADHIIVGVGRYRQVSNIYESINAASQNPTFTSIQHNLPLMPIYSVKRSAFEPNMILAGTELGVWQYDIAAQTWTEESGTMGRVPVHSLKFEQMGDIGCEVLYVATYGRGMYRTTDFTLSSCDTEIVGIADLENQISDLQLFPNPLQLHSNLEITLTETTDLTLRIFDLQGQMVRHQSLGEMAARKHTISIEKGDLKSGLYLIVLQSDKGQMSRKILVE